ncbi:MAG: glycosyltransferase family 2 protein [Rhodospirillaceae bacterium]|nr:glycosyltransferase family 2 protein [Rhodospirillaceae bacterium]
MNPDVTAGILAGIQMLGELDAPDLALFFWFTLIFELPRYLVGGLVFLYRSVRNVLFGVPEQPLPVPNRNFSVIIAGHNEAESLPVCVHSILEQTAMGDPRTGQKRLGEIVVVDDGSIDETRNVIQRLIKAGAIDIGLSIEMRGGKSAATNLAIAHCSHDFIIIVDADTTFDRDAFQHLLAHFDDPAVGAVGGNLFVRNPGASLTTVYQDIEYRISISLGRRISEMLDLLGIVSGAFGAFRRSAVEEVGGFDVEVGEDADITMKLRSAGWHLVFEPMARAGTDVPATVSALVRQRLRWDRSIVTIWWRKYDHLLNPFHASFSLANAAVIFDVVILQILISGAFFVYLVWIVLTFGWFTIVLLSATLFVYLCLSLVSLLISGIVDGRRDTVMLVVFLPWFVLFGCFGMRLVRLYAAVDELVFRRSYRDPYVPRRVMQQVERI